MDLKKLCKVHDSVDGLSNVQGALNAVERTNSWFEAGVYDYKNGTYSVSFTVEVRNFGESTVSDDFGSTMESFGFEEVDGYSHHDGYFAVYSADVECDPEQLKQLLGVTEFATD